MDYIHSKWGGSPKSYPFYKDAIYHSSLGENHLPRFYLLLKEKEIIGCAALLTNDYISRQDLYPWLACLFVEGGQERGGRAFGSLLMEFVEKEAKDLAFPAVYLTTEHDGYYENTAGCECRMASICLVVNPLGFIAKTLGGKHEISH